MMPPLTDKAASFARTETEEGTVGQWMRIETHPKEIDADFTLPGDLAEGVGYASAEDDEEILFLIWYKDMGNGRSKATHWAPLPAPPSDAALGNTEGAE